MRRPFGIIASALAFVAFGAFYLWSSIFYLLQLERANDTGVRSMESGTAVSMGLVFAGFAIVNLAVAIGVLRFQNWARVLAIVMCGLNLIAMLMMPELGLVWRLASLPLSFATAVYLMAPGPKSFFTRRTVPGMGDLDRAA